MRYLRWLLRQAGTQVASLPYVLTSCLRRLKEERQTTMSTTFLDIRCFALSRNHVQSYSIPEAFSSSGTNQ